MRRSYHGGQNARDWRRKIAALASKQREYVFTCKFGLDTAAGGIDFDAAARAYDIAEGIKKESLIGLLCAVHLSGFRLFSNEKEAQQFRNRARYPAAEFARALKLHAGIDNNAVTIEAIENAFSNSPRSKDGVAPSWSEDDLAVRLFQKWNQRSPREEERGEAEFKLAEGLAGAVVPNFDGWKELTGDAARALACADSCLQNLGPFPKLGRLPPENVMRPEKCTLAYDADSPFIDMDGHPEDIWLHQVVAVCAARLGRDGGKRSASALKKAIVTVNNNGLSWLFGKGLRYLRESAVEAIAEDLCVPEPECCRAEQLKAFADALPPNPFYETDHYSEFRASVGGKVASWVSNYWKRLDELEKTHAAPQQINIPEALCDSENATLFSGQHTNAAALDGLATQLAERIERAAAALAVLRGEGIPERQHVADVEQVADYVADLAGQIAMLDNRIEQEIERAEDTGRVKGLKAIKKALNSGKLKQPPKLNRISGGTEDAEGETERLERDFNATVRARRERFRILSESAAPGGVLDPLPVMEEIERRALTDRGADPARAGEQALRRLLHRIAGMSRRLSPGMAGRVRDAMTPLFANRKDANRYFHNRQGALYRHPFSTSRHEPYELHLDRVRETDWLAWLEDCMEEIRQGLRGSHASANSEALRDLLSLEGFVFSQRLRGLPDMVPGETARLGTGDGVPDIPVLLAAQLESEEVPRDTALRVFNLFGSAINGLSFRVFRDRFITRVKFQRQARDELFYAPKDRAWSPPQDYASAKGEIREGLELSAVVRDEAGDVLPLQTAESLSKDKFAQGSLALLRQMPHDWFVELDLRGGEPVPRAGLPLKQNRGGLKRWRRSKSPAFRLVGPPSYKTWLGRALTSADVKLGDYTLILDRCFEQSVRLEGEEIRLSAKPVRLKADLAVSVVDDRDYPNTESMPFDNIVGIDLGEKRIGYAVFSLADLLENGVVDPTESGTVAIPAFRRLMAAVRRHRRSRQPNQKVGQTYSRGLMHFRENVVGDVCNRIDTLCERFGAFPVLESSLGNFESGGRQLSMIYGSVLRRYTFSNVKAHKEVRKHYWHTSDSWGHPYLFVRDWNEKEKRYSGNPRRLNIFPGVTVNPAGTSQTCHRCTRNALAALREMPDRVEVEEEGRIVLGNGAILLYDGADYSPAKLKLFRRCKQRPRLNVPLRKGNRNRARVERVLRRNMRQAPKSEMSPDTTQARFLCVYEDCRFEGHSDENAAVNIGRRFLERIDIDASNAERV